MGSMGFMADFRTAANRIARSRWMMLVAAFLFMSSIGAFYSFGVYSQFMKITLNYNQQTLDTIAFFSSLYLGIIPGLINDYLGASSAILAGSGLNIFGFLMIWLAITKIIPRPQIWQMCFYHLAGANSGAFVSTAVLTTSVKNFSASRGMVIGLLKGYLGLSGALLTQIYLAIYGNNPSAYVLLATWLPAAVYLLLMVFIRPLPQHRGENETQKLYLFLGAAVLLAAYMMVVNLVQNFENVSHIDNEIIAAVMIVILFLPLIVVFRSDLSPQSLEREQNEDEESVEGTGGGNSEPSLQEDSHSVSSHTPLLPEISSEDQTSNNPRGEVSCRSMRRYFKLDDFLTGLRNQPSRGDDYTILQALLSLDIWILFVALTCGFGAGVTVIQNIGQIGSSLGYSQLHVTTAVSLLNIWGFIGRVGFGFASELFLQRKGVPRPLFFAVILATLCAGQLIFAFNLPGAFYVGSMVVGMCYGAQWPVMTAMVSEIFGLKFFGTFYNFAILASPLGSYILSVRVAGYLYDREANKQHAVHAIFHKRAASILVQSTQKSAFLCYGVQCYRLSFFIMATFSMFACFLSLILTARTRGFYKKQILIYNK
ncbi:hypothetical protein O6H91_04G003400 [Diphasiastrum complanatum]|uniref:Uncharacterized protein n=1 Tax=Diphasiastrum complanatum TaxID=34168 RepID=A0ACC2DTQ2_DIPCM|nr:hypothetical protein O6H91_04G003400 [Diphasiastrum complanatum]